MLLRLPRATTPTPTVGLRWRRGRVVDVDPEHGQPLLDAGAVEITREEAAEVDATEATARAPKKAAVKKVAKKTREVAAPRLPAPTPAPAPRAASTTPPPPAVVTGEPKE